MKSRYIRGCIAGAVAAQLMGLPLVSFAEGTTIVGDQKAPAAYVSVENNVTQPDAILFYKIKENDTVFVYRDENGAAGAKIGEARAQKQKDGSYSARVVLKEQIPEDQTKLWVGLKSYGKLESARVWVEVPAESVTELPQGFAEHLDRYIAIKNNTSIADELLVCNPKKADESTTLTPLPEKMTVRLLHEGKRLGEGVIGKDASLKLTLKAQLPQAGEKLQIVLIAANQRPAEPVEMEVPHEVTSAPIAPENIRVENHVAVADRVLARGLKERDTMKVYRVEQGEKGELLGSAVAKKSTDGAAEAIVALKEQLKETDQSLLVSVTGYGQMESATTKIEPIEAEKKTELDESILDRVIIQNNEGIADTITIAGLADKARVRIYAGINTDATAGEREIGTAVGKTGAATVVTLKEQLPREGESVYLTLTLYDTHESVPIKITIEAEAQQSEPLRAQDIQIAERAGMPHRVTIKGLRAGDGVKLYADVVSPDDPAAHAQGALLMSAAAKGETLELGLKDFGGTRIWATRTARALRESEAVLSAAVEAAQQSEPIGTQNVQARAYVGVPSEIQVEGLFAKEIVTVYDSEEATKPIAQMTAKANGVLTIPYTGELGASVWVSRTTPAKTESARQAAPVVRFAQSEPLDAQYITIFNHTGSSDTVQIRQDLAQGDIVRIYQAVEQTIGNTVQSVQGDLLAQVTVKTAGQLECKLKEQLRGDALFVTRTTYGRTESDVASVSIPMEQTSNPIQASQVTVDNYVQQSDRVSVRNLEPYDRIFVYDTDQSQSAGHLLGSGTANKDGTVTIALKDPLVTEEIYIARASKNANESTRTAVAVPREEETPELERDQIRVFNNVGKADSIVIKNLQQGTTVRVFAQQHDNVGREIGSATAKSEGELTILLKEQLSGDAIYLSARLFGKRETDPIMAFVPREEISEPLKEEQIIVENYVGAPSLVEVKDLAVKDIVKVFQSNGREIGRAAANKDGVALIYLKDGLVAGDDLYISVTGENKIQSAQTKKVVPAVPKAAKLNEHFIVIYNNAGMPDRIVVQNVFPKEVVRIYKNERTTVGDAIVDVPGQVLETVSAKVYGDLNIVLKDPLTDDSVWVSLTAYGKPESTKVQKAVPPERKSDEPLIKTMKIHNNAGLSDVIELWGLSERDQIKVYNDEMQLLASAVAKKDGAVKITLKEQLPEPEGDEPSYVYVTLSEYNKQESAAVSIEIPRERITFWNPKSQSIEADERDILQKLEQVILLQNNVVIADSVSVKSVRYNSTVRVYRAEDAPESAAVGSATAKQYGVLTVQLKEQVAGGETLWIAKADYGAKESVRVPVRMPQEAMSASLAGSEGTVYLYNYDGIPDRIEAEGLSEKDMLRIYDSNEGDAQLIGTATAGKNGMIALTLKQQLPEQAVWISRTAYNRAESARVRFDVPKVGETMLPWLEPKPAGRSEAAAPQEEASATTTLTVDFGAGTGQITSTTAMPAEAQSTALAGRTQSTFGAAVQNARVSAPSSFSGSATTQLSGGTPSSQSGTSSGTARIESQMVSNVSLAAPEDHNLVATSGATGGKTAKLDEASVNASGGTIVVSDAHLPDGSVIRAYNESGALLASARVRTGEARLRISTSERYVWLTVTEPGMLESIKIKEKL